MSRNTTGSAPEALSAEELRNSGVEQFRAGRYADCAVTLERMLRVKPGDLAAKQYLGDVREIREAFDRALAASEAGDSATCMAALNRVLEINPDDQRAQAAVESLGSSDGVAAGDAPTPQSLGLDGSWRQPVAAEAAKGTPTSAPPVASAPPVREGSASSSKWTILGLATVILAAGLGYLWLRRAPAPAAAVTAAPSEVSPGVQVDSAGAAERAAKARGLLTEAARLLAQQKPQSALELLEAARNAASGNAELLALVVAMERDVRAAANAVAEPDAAVPTTPPASAPTPIRQATNGSGGGANTKRVRPSRSTRSGRPEASTRTSTPSVTEATPAVDPAADLAFLTVQSSPPAEIIVDGVARGATPLKGVRLSPGTHTLSFRHAGYRDRVSQLELSAGEHRTLEVVLEALPSSPPPPSEKTPKAPVVAADHTASAADSNAPRVPTLALPPSVVVPAYHVDRMGVLLRPLPTVRTVLIAVEQTVTQKLGRSAEGVTRALQDYLYTAAKAQNQARVTIYPRVVGYLMADALLRGDKGIAARLVADAKSGRLARLTTQGWRPR